VALWMVRAGRMGQHEDLALDNGFACVGFQQVLDLSEVGTWENVIDAVRRAYPNASQGKVKNYAGQLHAFANRMQVGDLVALPLKMRRQIALGRVSGPYHYRTDIGDVHHTRAVEWIRPDVPRSDFAQDLLYSLGAFMTVCRIQRNNAEERVQAVLNGKPDPGLTAPPIIQEEGLEDEALRDIELLARDQILTVLESRFKGHQLALLVDAVLVAEGYKTRVSPPGPDGGVDILAGKGVLGFDRPTLCVQVKSSQVPSDVGVFRELQGTMSSFGADQGLLVSWSGYTASALREARSSYFTVRLWDADNFLEAVLRNYDDFPEEIQSELPLKRIWTLVLEE